jgi:hypothetical protein
MEQFVNESQAPIPKADVFAEAQRRSLAPSDDRFDRFRAAELCEDLVPIAGTTQRGFTPSQAQRFLDLLTLCEQLGTKRPRASALAFWLCWHGADDIRSDLVCEHIERTLISYLRGIRRQLDRKRGPTKNNQDPDRWRKAGQPWAKSVIKHFLRAPFNNGLALDVLSTLIGLALRALISQASFDAVVGILRRMALLLKIKDFNTEGVRSFWEMASEGLQLFTLDERQNPMVKAIRKVNASDNPSDIIGLVHDARRALAVMGAVFPIYDLSTAPVAPDPSAENVVLLFRSFPAAMCAITVLTRDHHNAQKMRDEIRAGNVEPILAEFHKIKVITDSMMSQIRKEQP